MKKNVQDEIIYSVSGRSTFKLCLNSEAKIDFDYYNNSIITYKFMCLHDKISFILRFILLKLLHSHNKIRQIDMNRKNNIFCYILIITYGQNDLGG